MRKHWAMSVAILVLAALAPLRAEEAKPAPALVLRLASFDDLLDDVKLLAGIADQEETVTQLVALVKARAGTRGLEGIDLKKPLGLYATVADDVLNSTAVVLVPVSDDKAFLALLKGLSIKVTKGETDVYSVENDKLPLPVYLRFAHGYACATVGKPSALADGALLNPETLLTSPKGSALSLTLRFDQVPDQHKQLALGQIALQLENLRERRFSGDTPAQKEFWTQAFEDLGNRVKSLFRDGREVTLRLDVDRDSGMLALDLSADAKPNSKLAADLTALGGAKGLLAGVPAGQAALRVQINASSPEGLRKALAAVVDEVMTKALDKAASRPGAAKATDVLKALEPSLKSGELEAIVDIRAPAGVGKTHTLVAGVRLKDGARLDKALRDVLADLPPGDRDRIKLDAETLAGVKVHRIDVQSDLPAQTGKMFGNTPLYVALQPEVLLLAAGSEATDALREALAAKPQTAPVAEIDVHFARLADAIALGRSDDKGVVAKAAMDAFADGKDADTLRFRVAGGKEMTLRLEIKTAVLKFVRLLDEAKKKDK